METVKPPQATICIVEDDTSMSFSLCSILSTQGYRVVPFRSANEFLETFEREAAPTCDLIVSDLTMPGSSGLDLCRKVRARFNSQRLPIILMTGSRSEGEKAIGIEAGADDFLLKPFRSDELVAKVRALLRIRNEEIKTLSELQATRERNTSLSRFVSPNLAHILESDNAPGLLAPHRAEVTVMFVDLRRFTAFADRAPPEEVLALLARYYQIVGDAAIRNQGTLGCLAGDGIMAFFNDPEPVPDHETVALSTALEVRERAEQRSWTQEGHDLGFGIGLAQGLATIGGIGFDRFWQYTVIGPVANIASRLCASAKDGQVLVTQRFLGRLRTGARSEPLGSQTLKGMQEPVLVHNVLTLGERKAAA